MLAFTLALVAATLILLITFASSLDPDQDHQQVGPDLDPDHLTPLKWFPTDNFLDIILSTKA